MHHKCMISYSMGSANFVGSDFERDLEAERRKTATLQDSVKESEKEYHKLKVSTRTCLKHMILLTICDRPSTTDSSAKRSSAVAIAKREINLSTFRRDRTTQAHG